MPPTSSLPPVAQFLENDVKEAWDLFDEEECNEANGLAKKKKKPLLEPMLGHLRRAGYHLLLAHGPTDFV